MRRTFLLGALLVACTVSAGGPDGTVEDTGTRDTRPIPVDDTGAPRDTGADADAAALDVEASTDAPPAQEAGTDTAADVAAELATDAGTDASALDAQDAQADTRSDAPAVILDIGCGPGAYICCGPDPCRRGIGIGCGPGCTGSLCSVLPAPNGTPCLDGRQCSGGRCCPIGGCPDSGDASPG